MIHIDLCSQLFRILFREQFINLYVNEVRITHCHGSISKHHLHGLCNYMCTVSRMESHSF